MIQKKERKRENTKVYFITLRTITFDPDQEPKKKKKEKSRAYEKVFDFSKERERAERKQRTANGIIIQAYPSSWYFQAGISTFVATDRYQNPGWGIVVAPNPCSAMSQPPPVADDRDEGPAAAPGHVDRSRPPTLLALAPSHLSLSRIHTYTNTRAHVRARDQARGFRFVQRANKNKRRSANWIYRGGARSAPGLRLLNAVLSTSKRAKPRFPSPHTVSAFAIAWNSRPWRAPRRSILSTRRAVRSDTF